ncbi:MAG: ABC transporter ATP-binding protein [Anaerolineae bacterium]|nr:ABC transporter ATP-binding protein [Anaerolineae bacterium]
MVRNSVELTALAWPVTRFDEAMTLLARRTGLGAALQEAQPVPVELYQAEPAALGRWVQHAADRLGLEAEPVTASLAELDDLVFEAAPAILHLPAVSNDTAATASFVVVLAGRQPWLGPKQVRLLGPDLRVHRVPAKAISDVLSAPLVGLRLAAVERLLAEAGVSEMRRERARQALLHEQLGSQLLEVGWLIRPAPGAGLGRQVRQARLWRFPLILIVASLVQQGLTVATWWIIGRGSLTGQFEWAWLVAWALLLFTAIPFQLLTAWTQSQFAYGVGAIFKQQLLYGALKLNPDDIRHQGMGQFLGRIMESEAVELLALNGGLTVLAALTQLATASWVLMQGGGGWPLVGLLWAWLVVIVGYSAYYYRHSHTWITIYRRMTNDLVERMVGHRTRLAQETMQNWHTDEDRELARYLELSTRRDRIGLGLVNLSGWWLVVGLAYAFILGAASVNQLAITFGGVLLAAQALSIATRGVEQAVQIGLSWEQVQPLFQAAAQPADRSGQSFFVAPPAASLADDEAAPSLAENGPVPVLLARDVNFRYRPQGRLAVHEANLEILPGSRLLLEGPSGGGKTTLAAVLAGLRRPESGLLMLWGYDQASLGSAEWRRHVAVAPQFHENHIFTETFAFNLLMGRRWPPTPEDMQLAETLCYELGLGELLERMPSGWQQIVGEGGWQLSHGERSRVFIARALLQQADVMILDESFGALDPENLERALRCTLKWAPTLFVIAHP